MKINGLQKLTLLDFPGHTACTVFTCGCNLRCPFCHNASLALGTNNDFIEEETFFDFLSKRKGILDGVCITGGEPLMQKDLLPFISKCREMGFLVKLDTNGFFPTRLNEIISSKSVDYIAMDIKNTLEKYPATVGISGIKTENIEKSVNMIISSGISHEFRTTYVKEFHSPDDFDAIGKLIKNADAYFIQSFKDSGELMSDGLHAASKNEMLSALEKVSSYVKETGLRGV